MAKYVVDFPMTIYATEVIEAESQEEAEAKAMELLDVWEFFCERLYPDYQGCDLHESWENCEYPKAQATSDTEKVTLDEETISDFLG